MPLTEKGRTIKGAMTEQYGEEKGEEVFYASRNKGTIKGVDGIVGEAATWATPVLGGPVGLAAGVARRVASPTPTASQAQENTAMGRSEGAGPFAQHAAPVTGDGGPEQSGMPVSTTPAPVMPRQTKTAPSGLNTGIDPPAGSVRDLARMAGAR